ncbi:hypothetical protein GCM10017783_09590 [Deinococcus piscis]|uniref:Uncharacterized protein n=1 Tax=Deinococcus piscis TaxID=394230 RepID=A0ABQ3K551_9DEIO|nr:hypothetical protein [Deinococcus piscis]GHF99594.1 hypothetical protein GCM10017783_09590 [Deinococcus piscis]
MSAAEPPTITFVSPTFSAHKHGPLLWPLLGWPWDARAQAQARLFEGWPAERLARVLGVPPAQVAALLRPKWQRRGPASAPPAAGQLGLTARPLWLQARQTGGFDAYTSPDRQVQAGAELHLWPAAQPAEVLSVGRGGVLLRLLGEDGADRLVWLRREDWPGLLALPWQA